MNIDATRYSGRPAEPCSAQEDFLRYAEAVGHMPTLVDLPTEG